MSHPLRPDRARQVLRVVDWDRYISGESRRKLQPPYPWVKLYTADLDRLGDLSLSIYGAYMRALSLAAVTNNKTPYDLKFLRRRANLTSGLIEALCRRGLVEIVADTAAALGGEMGGERVDTVTNEQPRDSAGDFSGTIPESLRNRSGTEREGEADLDPEGEREELSSVDRPLGPSPPPKNARGHDERPFDTIKRQVSEIAKKFNTTDPNEIHKLGGQSNNLSRRQCQVAVQQLREDGEL